MFKRWAPGATTAMVMLVLLTAGVSKLADLPAFQSALQTWTLLPKWAVLYVAVLVPALEVTTSLSWLLGLHRRTVTVGAACILVAATAAYACQAWLAAPPNCGCFGKLLAFQHSTHEARGIVARNGALIGLLLMGMCFAGPRPPDGSRGRVVTRRPDSNGASAAGFTLLEVMMAVVLVGLLIGLVSPLASRLRSSAQDAQSVANLRTHVQVFTVYAIDWRDAFPYFVDPIESPGTVTNPWRGRTVVIPYFLSFFWWPLALAEPYYGGDDSGPVFYHPGSGRWRHELQGEMATAPYAYGCCFLGAADYWNPEKRLRGISQLRPTHFSEVTFPRAKALLSEPFPALALTVVQGGSLARMGVGLVDGSAARVLYGMILPEKLGDGPPSDRRRVEHTRPFPSPLHTLDGVRGRDIP